MAFSWHHFESFLQHWAIQVPLEVLVSVGSFAEEIIPPIPAPLVMTTAGSLSLAQHHTLGFLLWLAVLGALGKTLADWLFYILGDKLEDGVTKKFGKFLGIRHEDIESIGKRFTGGWKDALLVMALRIFPFGPTVSLSVLCGIIRFNKTSFLVSTFLGLIVRDMMYLYTGYAGVVAFKAFLKHWHNYQHLLSWGIFLLALLVIWYLYTRSQAKQNNDSTSSLSKEKLF